MNHRETKMLKRATRQVTGLILRWIDKEPLAQSGPIAPEVTHKSPVMRLYAKHIFKEYLDWLTIKHPFRWLIRINVIFLYDNGMEQTETIELEARARLSELNDVAMEQIEEAMRAGSAQKYRHTEFEIKCLGA